MSYLTWDMTPACLSCDVPLGREQKTMSPAPQAPYGTSQRQRPPIDREPLTTAVQVAVAWAIAFTCVALIALFS